MLRNGASLLTVQALLGHAAITSTQAYTKLYPKDLIKMHRANHPREKHKNIQLPELKVPFFLYGKVRFQHQ
jgi:integrase